MKRAVTILAAALAACACSTGTADDPAPQENTSSPSPPREEPQEHTMHITVSGPDDTVMVVEREGRRSYVELEGEPFDFEFTESEQEPSELGIAVFAKTEEASDEPLRCAIDIDGEVVAEDSAEELDADGMAEVACTVPRAA